MLDLKLLRQDPEQIKARLLARSPQYLEPLERLIALDELKRKKQKEAEELQAQINKISKSIKNPQEAESIKAQVQNLKETQLAPVETQQNELETQIQAILSNLPNPVLEDTPLGADENANVVVKTVGEIKPISNLKDHVELGLALGLLDFDNSVRLAGSRFSSFIGFGAKLRRALIDFFLAEAEDAGYQEIATPYIALEKTLFGTSQLPKFADDQYKLEGLDQYLIPTAEVTLTSFYNEGNALALSRLPLRLVSHSPCFRKESGSAGKDTSGLIRLHQFDKVEAVHVCEPEQGPAELERLTSHAESLLTKLGLPFRRVALCAGDIGFSAAKTYDLEAWFPAQDKYREVSSCSLCTDFQARRMNFRYKNALGKNEFVYTLNGSALPIGRIAACILENYQIEGEDGFVLPQVLNLPLRLDQGKTYAYTLGGLKEY